MCSAGAHLPYRCYEALLAAGLPGEIRLRRLIMEDFPDIDLVSDLPTERIEACVTAARRLAADARARAEAEDIEPFATSWQRHAEWLDWWAGSFSEVLPAVGD